MKLVERLRRWWKPAEYDDERAVADDERADSKPPDFFDRAAKFDGYTAGGRPIDPDDAFRH